MATATGASGNDLPGLAVAPLTAWLCANVADLAAPLHFEHIAGGHSNLTYRVVDGRGRRIVLRRPPLGPRPATAHDMAREHRILSALGATSVPVPEVLGLCEDARVTGAPFYVMSFVDGLVVRDVATALAELEPAARRTASISLVEALADLHALDIDARGLGRLGRREDYLARQLRRWRRQWQEATADPVGPIGAIHDRLARAIPDQASSVVVHGDFRLDNCVISSDSKVRAVLDWELCALGDPLADLGMLVAYWSEPEEPPRMWPDGPTQAAGFLRSSDLIAFYGELTGRDVSRAPYYTAFAYWKLACIIEGVRRRFAGGGLVSEGHDQLALLDHQQAVAVESALGLLHD